jgi:hypothetical protein
MIPTAPTGIARFFYVAGLLVFFAGFALFAYAIVTTMAEFFQTFNNFNNSSFDTALPNFARVGRVLPLAFGLAIPGAIVATLASALGPHPDRGPAVQIGHVGDRIQGPVVKGGGQIHVAGSIQYQNISQIIGDLHTINDVVSGLALAPRTRYDIERYLDEAERELRQRQPDRTRVGDNLTRATQLMKQAGAFAQAGEELIPRLWGIASFLGAAGMGVLRLLS